MKRIHLSELLLEKGSGVRVVVDGEKRLIWVGVVVDVREARIWGGSGSRRGRSGGLGVGVVVNGRDAADLGWIWEGFLGEMENGDSDFRGRVWDFVLGRVTE